MEWCDLCISPSSQAARAGRLDGKVGIPSWSDPDHAPKVQDLAEHAEERIGQIRERFDRKDTGLYRAFTLTRARYQQSVEVRDEAQKVYDEAAAQHELDHGRKPVGVRPTNKLAYWGGMLLLILLIEFPLSYSAFKIMHQPIFVTGPIALGASLLLAVLAHFAASWIVCPRPREAHQIAGIVMLFVIVPIALLGLSFFRETWLASQLEVAKEAGEIAGAAGVGLVPGTLIFWLLNIIAYGGAIVWALRELDPVAVALTDLRAAKARLARAERRFQLAYQARVKNAYYHHSCAIQLLHASRRLVDTYNEANLRERYSTSQQPPPQGRPESFRRYPHIEVPEHLEDPVNNLDWR